jgi:ABC-2 type transport system permease protein
VNRFADVLRSEWTKIRTVRSTWWSLAAALFVTLGSTALVCGVNIPENTLIGIVYGQVAIAVLGVLTIGGEYSSGMIRTSFLAVPDRLRLLAAKLTVFAALAFVAAETFAVSSFVLGQAIWATKDAAPSLRDPGVARAVFGAGLLLTASGVFAFAIGALVRSTAAGITLAVTGLFIAPQFSRGLPGEWGQTVSAYFLSNAAEQLLDVTPDNDGLPPWIGLAVFCLYIAAGLALAAVTTRRRDV